MTLLVVLEQRFEKDQRGDVWAPSTFDASFWTRYLRVFDRVQVFARLRAVDVAASHLTPVRMPAIRFAPVPDFSGVPMHPATWLRVRREGARALREADAVVVRAPSLLAGILEAPRRALARPLAVEVVGDPAQAFAPGGVCHPFRPVARALLSHWQRRQCAAAVAVAYVSRRALESRYPPGLPKGDRRPLVTEYSSVELDDRWFAPSTRPLRQAIEVTTVAGLDQPYKGVDVWLRVLARCRDAGVDVRGTVVGDGKYRAALQRLRDDLGLQAHVTFAGALTGERVWQTLCASDVFVLASRSEGLPRSLLEAMAIGLPCVATKVGGISDLLPEHAVVPVDDVEAMAEQVIALARDPARRHAEGDRNREAVRPFHTAELTQRRDEMLRHLRAAAAMRA